MAAFVCFAVRRSFTALSRALICFLAGGVLLFRTFSDGFMGIFPDHFSEFVIADDVQTFQKFDTLGHKGTTAHEAFLFGIVEESVFVKDGIVVQDLVFSGRQTCRAGCIAGDDDPVRRFAPDHALDHIGGQMMSVGDDHGGEVIVCETGPDGVPVTVDAVGDPVAEMCQQGRSC